MSNITGDFECILYTRVLFEVKKAFEALRARCENLEPPGVKEKIMRKGADVLKEVVCLVADELAEEKRNETRRVGKRRGNFRDVSRR
jgi:hypothetical protein